MVKKKSVEKIIREPGAYQVLVKRDGKVIYNKQKLTKEQFCKLYFSDLDACLLMHPDWNPKQFLQFYQTRWNKLELISSYTDSYGHIWQNTKPSNKVMLNYIENEYKKKYNRQE